MTARFLVTIPIPDPGPSILKDAGELTVLDEPPSDQQLKQLLASGDYDVVITQLSDQIDAEMLEAAQVSGISNFAVGYNNIDVDAAARQAIEVTNTPGVLTDATADVAMALMLSTGRRVVEGDALVRRGEFTGWRPEFMLGRNVSGQTLGLAGFGRIARSVARRALAFDMDVLFAPRPPHHRAVSDEELGEFAGRVTQVSWDDLVERSDYLSLHVPAAESTHHLVHAGVLERMKKEAILINTARGPIVDEQALVAALRAGEISAAGLDVYEHEPALAEGLADLPNTVLLPHVGSATVPVRAEMSRLSAENAVAVARGDAPPHPVTA